MNDDCVATGKPVSLDEERRLVYGWAYVVQDTQGNTVYDKSGDFVADAREIEDAAYDYVIRSRRGGLNHLEDVTVSTLVESIVFTPDKVKALGIPQGYLPLAWWVGFRIESDAVWEAYKRGEYPAFSVHGSGVRTPVEAP